MSPFGNIVEECRHMFQELNTITLFFIKRYANMAVHVLARETYSFPDRVSNMSDVPLDVTSTTP